MACDCNRPRLLPIDAVPFVTRAILPCQMSCFVSLVVVVLGGSLMPPGMGRALSSNSWFAAASPRALQCTTVHHVHWKSEWFIWSERSVVNVLFSFSTITKKSDVYQQTPLIYNVAHVFCWRPWFVVPLLVPLLFVVVVVVSRNGG